MPLKSSSRLWHLDFQLKCKIYFHLKKETLDHWVTDQLFFSLAQVKRFWHCLWFRSGLTWEMQHLLPMSWICLSVVALDALTPASVHSFWSSPKFLNDLCLTIFPLHLGMGAWVHARAATCSEIQSESEWKYGVKCLESLCLCFLFNRLIAILWFNYLRPC